MGVQSLLLEGGPRLAGAFLDAGEVDEMRIFVAPIALGGRGARMSVEGEGADTIEHAQHAASIRVETVGEDVLIKARLREW
jgi:diaminohydroxyphosphoribosylaminopyrimidine deaminase / 5-amino-6-(5-phosphoribosylamino)uracil reductase